MLGWLVLAALFLWGVGTASQGSCKSPFYLPGDFLLGGFFPIHRNSTGRSRNLQGQLPLCTGFYTWGYAQSQAMRLAVEEINNSPSLLPSVSLGYHIWDTCEENLYLQALFQLAPNRQHHPPSVGDLNRIVGIVGPEESAVTPLVSHILTLYGFPQISYSIKAQALADKSQFPLLFRMVPSEVHQLAGILALVKAFRWKWISAVGDGTKATQTSVQTLIATAASEGICVSYQAVTAGGPVTTQSQLQKAVENIERARTNVTIVLGTDTIAQQFFQVVIELKITGKVWVAIESWVLSASVSLLPGMEQVGTVVGLTIKPIKLPHIIHFAKEALQGTAGSFCLEPQEPGKMGSGCPQSCQMCQPPSPETLRDVFSSSVWQWSFYSYAAVYALAQALHRLLGCNREVCHMEREPHPWQLFEMLHEVDFPLLNNTIKFSSQQDLFLGFDVITWTWENGTANFVKIGSYTAQSLNINQTQIGWQTPEGQVPNSTCIAVCDVGQSRSKQMPDECLCRCDDCMEGTYQNQTNSEMCLPCPPGTWSPPKSGRCFPPAVTYLDLTDGNIVALVVMASVGFLMLCGCLLVFATHRQTPVVRAAGGQLAFVMLVSLLASCAATMLFVGQPTPLSCRIRQPIFALSFTACISCLLVRSFQVVVIFKMAGRLPPAQQCWLRLWGPRMAVGLSCGLQGLLCALWLCFSPPALQKDALSAREVFLHCSEGHSLGLGAVLGYITLLGGTCVLLAFWGRHLPKNYAEARLLSTGTLVFLMAWGSYLLIYTTTEGKGRQITALQMFTVQTSVYAILCTFFLPKCFVILFRPQQNTVAHFQTCIQAYTTNATAASPAWNPGPGPPQREGVNTQHE